MTQTSKWVCTNTIEYADSDVSEFVPNSCKPTDPKEVLVDLARVVFKSFLPEAIHGNMYEWLVAGVIKIKAFTPRSLTGFWTEYARPAEKDWIEYPE